MTLPSSGGDTGGGETGSRSVSELVALDAAGEELWREACASWPAQDRHDAFIQYCFAEAKLPAAAARYRARLEQAPEDQVARRMCDRIVFLSMQALTAREKLPVRRPFWHSPLFVVVLIVGAAVGALLGFVWGGAR